MPHDSELMEDNEISSRVMFGAMVCSALLPGLPSKLNFPSCVRVIFKINMKYFFSICIYHDLLYIEQHFALLNNHVDQ